MLRLVLVAAACLVLAAAAPLANTDVITTTLGPVRGKVMEVPDSSGSSVRAFLGIPYAKPPVGALRFRSPEAAAAWSDTLDAFEQGPACHQINDEHIFDGHMSEDCLTLNIWTPPDATEASKLPVMLWVYGGSFVKGGTRDPVFDARNLAHRTGVVVVSVNYRLGALGWMVHPGNTRTVTTRNGETHETAGNYGLMDQRLAMEFVVANVAKFGGDPKHITAFGESAGGISLCMQMAADYSYEPTVVPGPPPSGPDQGLPDRHLVPFQQVILLSGPCVQGLGPALPTYTSWKFRTDAAKQLAKALACSNADVGREFECIASRPASEIIAAQVPLDWGPVTDYVLIPDDPLAMFSQQREAAAAWFPDTGEITEVAVIAGFVHDEGTLFVPDKDLTHAQMKGGMVQSFPQNSATVYDKYAGTDSSAYYEFANALGDQFFMCPTRRLLDLLPQAPVARYGYLFNHAPSFVDERHAHMRSFHSSELFFVFGNPRAGFSFTDGEKRLSQRMMDMFGSFARTGAPTTLEVWPSYESFTRPLLVFNTDPSPPVTHNHKQDVCDFWDSMTLLFE